MFFEIVGEITRIQTIATGRRIRVLARLKKLYGPGRWRKMQGAAMVRLAHGQLRQAEVYWYGAHGVGKRGMKRAPRRYVVCIANKGNEGSLERNKLYVSLPDPKAEAEGLLRVIDEDAEDYLYPAGWFVAVELPKAVQDSLRKAS